MKGLTTSVERVVLSDLGGRGGTSEYATSKDYLYSRMHPGQPPKICNHFSRPWRKLPLHLSSPGYVLATPPLHHLRDVWASPRAAHCRGNRRRERCIVVCNKMQEKDPEGTIESMGQWESSKGCVKPIGTFGGGRGRRGKGGA